MKTEITMRNGRVFVGVHVGAAESRNYRHAVRSAAKLQGKTHESVLIGSDYIHYDVSNGITFITIYVHKWKNIF